MVERMGGREGKEVGIRSLLITGRCVGERDGNRVGLNDGIRVGVRVGV